MRPAAILAAALGLVIAAVAGCNRAPEPVRVYLWDWAVTVDRGRAAVAQAQLESAAAALARRGVVLVWPDGERFYHLSELGVHLDVLGMARDAATIALGRRLPAAELPVVAARARIDTAALEEALAPVQQLLAVAPVPAQLYVQGDAVHVIPDAPGRRIDEIALARQLRAALAAGPPPATAPAAAVPPPLRLDLPLVPVEAAVTAAALTALGIRRRVATFSTVYDPAIPRAENVERAARAIDGVIIRPGELFSYNATVGPVSADEGWQAAWVIADGRLVRGVGGGVCQTATTVYGAALRAGLTVLERHPHALAVSYIDLSQDAAVAPGWQDLKLRNDRATAVLLRTEAALGRVTVHVYGDAPPDVEIRIESELLATIPAPTEVVSDPTLTPGEEVVDAPGQPGYRSAAYRIYYQQGRPVRREQLSVDEYPPEPRLVRRGT